VDFHVHVLYDLPEGSKNNPLLRDNLRQCQSIPNIEIKSLLLRLRICAHWFGTNRVEA